MSKLSPQEQLDLFEKEAPQAIRSGKDGFDFLIRNGISPSFINRYSSMQQEYYQELNPQPTPEEVELAKLEREAAAAMGIIE